MIIRDGSQSLEITFRERGPAGTPAALDLGINVAVVHKTFSGRNDSVWVQGSDWRQFTRHLAELDRTRKGEAVINAMSPRELRLRIFASDKAGHIMAEGWVGRDYTTRGGLIENRVSFAIEVDPTTLPALMRQFESMI